MEGYREFFKGKKMTVLGLGLLGRGVGDVAFLAECGAEVVVVDKKSEAELAESVARLEKYPNITFHLGTSNLADFTHTDMVIKAAGVPLDSPEIAAARGAGVPVYMSTALFAKYAREASAKIVGITGTRGKSTVTQMIYHTLQHSAPRPSSGRERKVFLGGNVRGKSTLAMLAEVAEGDICVLELDSWQLQGFGDLKISPHIAVFTNLMPDHMNYYNGDMEKYFEDKANIFKFQEKGDSLFVGQSILGRVEAAGRAAAPHVPPSIPSDWNLKVIGEHNRENASFACAALQALGLSPSEIRAGIESFEAVEGRLQFVRDIGAVKIYNDNNATTPEATISALRSFSEPVTLITGGSEKGLALEELVSEIKKSVSHVILLTHPNYKGSVRLVESLKKASIAYEEAGSLQEAVAAAVRETSVGVILFSPAFASFGMFQNEYERNDQFMEIVKTL